MEYTILILALPLLSFLLLGLLGTRLRPTAAGVVGTAVIAVVAAVSYMTAYAYFFTTGRGTPLGSPVPTVKIATNSELARNKKNWIDFNAGRLLSEDERTVTNDLLQYIVKLASGDVKTQNELHGYAEISIFKDGVVL